MAVKKDLVVKKVSAQNGSLDPRKPRQQRSQETVERIFAAALKLISERGIEALTTNHIADTAGISVASVYQFFPNKLAIVQALHSQWLSDIDERVDKAILETQACTCWQDVAGAIGLELSRFTLSPEAEIELIRAMWSHRELLDLDRARNRLLSAKIAEAMSRFGGNVDRAGLEMIAGLALEIFTLVAYKNVGLPPAELEELNRLAQHLFLSALGQQFA
jgi:AcrR family transcriptional regulator